MLPIETPRLLLREIAPADAGTVANLVGNWNVARWLGRVPFPYAIADAEAFITDILLGTSNATGTIAAIERDGQLIGLAGIEPKSVGFELGYWLGEAYWGNGYMSEASLALVAAFFQTTTETELHAGYLVGNIASARILSKLGFEQTGQGQMFSISNGRAMPDIVMKLTRETFSRLHP